MFRSLFRRFLVLLIGGFTGYAYWNSFPGTTADRVAFETACRAFANPPFVVTGAGSHDSPWCLSHRATIDEAATFHAPVVVSIGDDPDAFFQSSPPSPIDMAVILRNFQRLGIKHPAIACVMAWDSPDPIALSALDQVLNGFDSLVMCAPLSRSAVPETMPEAFRKASIPLKNVDGNYGSLPVVNRIPMPGIILGGNNTMAGFQSLDSETSGSCDHLLAVWNDRIVLSFPLVATIRKLGISPEQIQIHVGKWIHLGVGGPWIPIDSFGRMSSPTADVKAAQVIAAEDLIDSPDDTLIDKRGDIWVLRDDLSAAEQKTRDFSAKLVPRMATVSANASWAAPRCFQRMPKRKELVLLGMVVLVLAGFAARPMFSRNVVFLCLGLACVASQLLAASANLWLPGAALLVAVVASFLVCMAADLVPSSRNQV